MEENYMQLYDSILSTHEISCNKCRKANSIQMIDDSMEAMEIFYADGWRANKNGVCTCPKCNKSKTKKLKKDDKSKRTQRR